jgi:hypothetical protein
VCWKRLNEGFAEYRGKYFGQRHTLTGDWIKLHYGELHNFYSSTNIIRMVKWRDW